MSDFKYEKLKEIRTSRGYTQAEMADKIGIARTTYADYEKGRILPPVDKIKRICVLFSLPLSDLTNVEDDVENMDVNSAEFRVYHERLETAKHNISIFDEIYGLIGELDIVPNEAALLNSAVDLIYDKYYCQTQKGGRLE